MPHPIQLAFSTKNPAVDRMLLGLVELTELLIPGKVAAYYLCGSHANGTAVPTSDLDLHVLLRNEATPQHVAGLRAAYRHCRQIMPVLLDAVVSTEEALRRLGRSWVIQERKFLFGTDVLAASLPAVPPEVEVRQWMEAAVSALRRLYSSNNAIPLPATPRKPLEEWYGFADLPVRMPDGREEPGLRRLPVEVYWPANALLVWRTGQPTVFKTRELADRFRDVFGGEWYPWLLAVLTRCKWEWHYRIPADPAARAEVREMCRQAVRFHNHFFTAYRGYLLAELSSPDGERHRFAAQALGRAGWRDAEIEAALLAASREDPEVSKPAVPE